MNQNNALKLIDENLSKLRGYVSKLPKNKKVVVVFSGGLDSVSIVARCIKEYNLEVFPISIIRGQANYEYEQKAVKFYDKLFSKRFPDSYNKCFEIQLDTPSKSYKHMLTEKLKSNHVGYPARNTMIFLAGAEYAYSLRSKNINISTIFGASVVSDTLFHSSLTWARVTNLAICQFLNDYNWQLLSLAVEKELGNSYDKDILIRYCNKIGIPLENTRTCTEKSKTQCGICICCYDRRRCFQDAQIKDKTKYLNTD